MTANARLARSIALILLVLVAAAGTCAAQTIRGTITGTVTDSTGAVVPAATVIVTHAGTGIDASAVSNQQGSYTIPLLPPGTYQASVELPGFKKYVRHGVVVEIAQTRRSSTPTRRRSGTSGCSASWAGTRWRTSATSERGALTSSAVTT
jgi:hypothetical protein